MHKKRLHKNAKMFDQSNFLCFVGVVLIYGSLSSPTPDNIGFSEILIGLLLIVFSGVKGLFSILVFPDKITSNCGIPLVIKFIGFSIILFGSVIGLVYRGNTIGNFLRDIIPLLYLFLPIIMLPQICKEKILWGKRLAFGLSFVGVCFSIRFIMINPSLYFSSIGKTNFFGDMNYFQMDPAVLFSAVFLSIFGLYKIFCQERVLGLVALAFSAFPVSVIFASVVRAQIGLLILSLLVFFIRCGLKRWTYLTLFTGIFILFFVFSNGFLHGIFEVFLQKHQAVGLNARDREFAAVLEYINRGVVNFLVGTGWGGVIYTPICPGVPVRFVHNFFGYFLLKVGFVGILLVLSYIGWIVHLFYKWWRYMDRSYEFLAIFLAAMSSFLINSCLEAGYKSLSFGFILVLPILFQASLATGKFTGVENVQ